MAYLAIDVAINMIPDFSSIFDSPIVDRDVLGVQKESDFYLGMAWVSITDHFNFAVVDKYQRQMSIEEAEYIVRRLWSRLPEIKKANSELGI